MYNMPIAQWWVPKCWCLQIVHWFRIFSIFCPLCKFPVFVQCSSLCFNLYLLSCNCFCKRVQAWNEELIIPIVVRNRMFLGMQDFDFAQIQSNLPKSHHFCLNFASILPKSNQYTQKSLLGNAAASLAPMALLVPKLKWNQYDKIIIIIYGF